MYVDDIINENSKCDMRIDSSELDVVVTQKWERIYRQNSQGGAVRSVRW